MSRSKDQWIQETGGFRFGESDEQFHVRVAEISRLRQLIAEGKAKASDIEALAKLLGTDSSDE